MSFAIVLITVFHLLCPPPTINQQISFWSWIHNIDPITVEAISETETGDVPEKWEPPSRTYPNTTRETVISKGNYGRLQINCTTWKKNLGITDCKELLNDKNNIRYATYIIKRFKNKFAKRYKGKHSHRWIGHYNSGNILTDRGKRYADKTLKHIGEIKRCQQTKSVLQQKVIPKGY